MITEDKMNASRIIKKGREGHQKKRDLTPSGGAGRPAGVSQKYFSKNKGVENV
jgi:hypothetical protein